MSELWSLQFDDSKQPKWLANTLLVEITDESLLILLLILQMEARQESWEMESDQFQNRYMSYTIFFCVYSFHSHLVSVMSVSKKSDNPEDTINYCMIQFANKESQC